MDKKQLTEADIISKFILPAITDAGWDTMTQIRQEVKLRDGKGRQQGPDYAGLLEVPFVFASKGDGFIFHDKTNPQALEIETKQEDFPSPSQLWDKFCDYKGYTKKQLPIITQDYHDDGSGKAPRYYQIQAINKTIEAISLD